MFLNFIKYILETKTILEWSKYSFKIDFHILKGLKTNLKVKILKNDKNCQIQLTACGRSNWVVDRMRLTENGRVLFLLELFELSESTVMTSSLQSFESTFDRPNSTYCVSTG